MRHFLLTSLTGAALTASLALTGCESSGDTDTASAEEKIDVTTMESKVVNVPTKSEGGFVVFEEGDVTWVFLATEEEAAKHMAGKELAKHVTTFKSIDGKLAKLKGANTYVIDAYVDGEAPSDAELVILKKSKSGFATKFKDGSPWVFEVPSEAYDTITGGGELAKHTTKGVKTDSGVALVKAADGSVIDAFMAE